MSTTLKSACITRFCTIALAIVYLLGATAAGSGGDLGVYAGYEVGAVGVAFSTSTSCLALPPDGCLSAGGDTKLDTGTLSYEHFNDIEKSQSRKVSGST